MRASKTYSNQLYVSQYNQSTMYLFTALQQVTVISLRAWREVEGAGGDGAGDGRGRWRYGVLCARNESMPVTPAA
jgi:hypothetical protein